jgi:predicted dehydrogenase
MSEMNRRTFLNMATGAWVASSLSPSMAATEAPPIRIGLIGCGWYGGVLLDAAYKVGGVDVVALCDVDQRHLRETAEKLRQRQGREPRTFRLYHEMLAAGGLDAVFIATPPHWHALQFLAALDAGVHIYCEKPLAYDIRECQAMVRAARAHPDRVIQIGFQRRQSLAIREVRERVQRGELGQVRQVDVQIHYTAGLLDSTPQDPPPELDWELWCGPAPKLPYSPQIGHKSWRLEKEYGHGHLVDWGIHWIDAVRWILNADVPRRVEASGTLVRYAGRITTPDTMTAVFDFDGIPVVWRHRLWGAQEYDPDTSNGVFLYGDEGTIFVTDHRWVFIPRGRPAERKTTEAKADLARLHMEDFLAAVRQRRAASGTVSDAYRSTAAVKLAMMSLDLGRPVKWDSKTHEAVGDEAIRLMKRDYRAPYVHPWRGEPWAGDTAERRDERAWRVS